MTRGAVTRLGEHDAVPTHHRGNDMTDTPTPPDGWYPDPAGSGGLRRWNGTAWTDEVRPAAGEVPAAAQAPGGASVEPSPAAGTDAPTVESPVPPAPVSQPVAPQAATPPVPPTSTTSAPAYSSAPAYPGTSASSSAPAYPGSGAPAYPTAPAAPSAAAPARSDIPTDTVWIWLVVALPLVSLLALFLFDWSAYVQESIYASLYPEQAPYAAAATLTVTAGASAFSFVVAALTVLFSFLDWRQLRARGIQKPFHWAWSFFVFAISSGGVYIIGRAVVLRRQTGKGLAPVWGWIAVMLVTVIAGAIWVAALLNTLLPLIEQLQYYGY